jgi:hypothetical protein
VFGWLRGVVTLVPRRECSIVFSTTNTHFRFINFYPSLRELATPPIEFVSKAGDLVFVPSGWWHCVLNLEDTENPGAPVVALTQNFVSSANLSIVCRFLRDRRDQVSGCSSDDAALSLYERFAKELRIQHPEFAKLIDSEPVTSERLPTLWDSMRRSESAEDAAPFSFSF